VGESTQIDNLRFTLRGLRDRQGPNYQAVQGWVEVTKVGKGDGDSEVKVVDMLPEKRIYNVQRMPMTEAAITTGLVKDLYVSLGEPVEGGAWIVRIYVKPFIDWIWGGCLLMALGGGLAATDRRYRAKRTAAQALPAGAAVS
jgi:cytochrome c-type biogenesis protein CcmF